MQPFLTVVTRCFKRPQALKININSLKTQVDPDYEQVFIIDTVGLGLAAADQALNKYKEYCNGKYVMVLDDDDYIKNNKFIKILKERVKVENPDVLIWKGTFSHISYPLPPNNSHWGNRVIVGYIGSFNYAIRQNLYNNHVHVCRTGSTGDYDLIYNVLNSNPKPKVSWIKEVLVGTQHKGMGRDGDILEETKIPPHKKADNLDNKVKKTQRIIRRH